MRQRVCVVLAGLAAAITGCTGSGPPREGATSVPGPVAGSVETSGAADVVRLRCEDSIDRLTDLPDDYEAVLDAVALPTASSSPRALQAVQQEAASAPDHFAKAGLLVRAGSGFSVSVATEAGTAALGWGGGREANGRTVASDGCDDGDGWLVFAGGFFVDAPRCLDVVVSSGDEQETVQVGVGAACGGQAEPAES